jgi:hypothetical protein
MVWMMIWVIKRRWAKVKRVACCAAGPELEEVAVVVAIDS